MPFPAIQDPAGRLLVSGRLDLAQGIGGALTSVNLFATAMIDLPNSCLVTSSR